MKHLKWRSLFSLITCGCLIPLVAEAQVTPDGTTSTTVNQDGNNFTIEQGDRVGDNLFHSFNEFSVPTSGSAAFNNAGDIANIFSRVTGSSISTIDGLLSANGAANLFLINPNGIIFGENGSLNLGGSFFASTADSLLFEGNTEFSASNPQAAPLLEVSIPIGLNFRDNPGDIVNRSQTNINGLNVGLLVPLGKSLSLIGGDINLAGGQIFAPEGRVKLGGLAAAGKVDINDDGSLTFPNDVARADVLLSNGASVNVPGDGGSIDVNASNLRLSGSSGLFAGIIGSFGGEGTVGGDINIDATNEIVASQGSRIQSRVYENSVGNAGNINIQTGSLSLTEGSLVTGSTYGNGNGGDVTINASNNIAVDGFGNEGIPSGIFSNVSSENAVGNAGEIKITTDNLTLTNGGVVNSVTFGEGNAGKVTINAGDSISIDGQAEDPFFNSTIASGVANTGKGNSDGIEITTGNLTVTNGGLINGRTSGDGNGGSINIQANSLFLENGGTIDGSTFGQGDAGKVTINASDSISLDDGGIGSEIVNPAKGNSGGIDITTSNLSLTNGSKIDANTSGEGNAGKIIIRASNFVSLDDTSAIASLIEDIAKGDSGGIEITTANLSLTNGSLIDASTLGEGNAGKITVNATDSISVDGLNSAIGSVVENTAKGNSGEIDISTANLSLSNKGQINVSTFGEGNAAKITVNATDSISIDNSDIGSLVTELAEGNSEGIEVNTANLSLTNGGQINSSTFGQGNAGKIIIDANGIISADGAKSAVLNGVGASARANSGGIEIITGDLSLTNGAEISASTEGEGNGGQITIDAIGTIFADGKTKDGTVSSIFSVVQPQAQGDAGDININTGNLFLTNGGEIDAATFGQGDGGEISINAADTIFADGGDSGVFSSVGSEAKGNAGDINVSTGDLFLTNEGKVNSSTSGQGNGGEISINAAGAIFAQGDDSGVFSSVNSEAKGNAGDINVSTTDLVLINRGIISSSTFSEGNAGKITVNASDTIVAGGIGGIGSIVSRTAKGNSEGIEINTPILFLVNRGLINTNSFGLGNAGNITVNVDYLNLDSGSSIAASNTPSQTFTADLGGGNINLNISDILILRNNSQITAQASQNANGGNVTINAPDRFIIAFPQNNDITANASQGRGGNINITAESIFGIEERPLNPFTNDINASSEFGLQGGISINTPDIDPTTGLINLPASVGDASDQISQNPCEQGVGSEFIITGKGGLPPNVNESLNSESAQVGLIEAVPSQAQTVGANAIPPEKPTPEAVPAQGWIFNDKGEVTLTAYSTSDNKIQRSGQQHPSTCSSKIAP
jgi:filamentous hemagglutinin family protein